MLCVGAGYLLSMYFYLQFNWHLHMFFCIIFIAYIFARYAAFLYIYIRVYIYMYLIYITSHYVVECCITLYYVFYSITILYHIIYVSHPVIWLVGWLIAGFWTQVSPFWQWKEKILSSYPQPLGVIIQSWSSKWETYLNRYHAKTVREPEDGATESKGWWCLIFGKSIMLQLPVPFRVFPGAYRKTNTVILT